MQKDGKTVASLVRRAPLVASLVVLAAISSPPFLLASQASPPVAVVITAANADPVHAKRLGIVIRVVNEGSDAITLEWQDRASYLSYLALLDARSCELPLKSLSSIHHSLPPAGQELPKQAITLGPRETIKLPGELDLSDDFFRAPGFYGVTVSYLIPIVGRRQEVSIDSNQLIFEVASAP